MSGDKVPKARVGDRVPKPGPEADQERADAKADRNRAKVDQHLDHETRMANEMRANRPRIISVRSCQDALMDNKACPCCLAINTHRSACLYRAFMKANDQQMECRQVVDSARRFASELLRNLR